MTPVEALQKALAAEHAALFLYAFLGSRISGSSQPTLLQALSDGFETHRDQRDALTVLISAKGVDPVAAEIDYELPRSVSSPAQVTAAARTVEERITQTYGELVAHTSGADRRWAIAALDRSALRGLALGVRPVDFPGID